MSATEAKAYLESIPRICRFEDRTRYSATVFLLPEGVGYSVCENSEIVMSGFSPQCDGKPRDLINPITVIDPLNMRFEPTNVLTPLLYAESLEDILWHITTQAILYTRATDELLSWIRRTQEEVCYQRHEMDRLWLPCGRPLDEVRAGELVSIFNRRVDGWDGSHDRPVIELLGTGGHLPSVWDAEKRSFRTLTFAENLQKEAGEEMALAFPAEDIHLFGGYRNEVTHELVILAGIEIPAERIPAIEAFAVQNIDADSMGIYLGTFPEVIAHYRRDPRFFAGGKKAAATNFPCRQELMARVEEYFRKKT